jgi:hypothetical protein
MRSLLSAQACQTPCLMRCLVPFHRCIPVWAQKKQSCTTQMSGLVETDRQGGQLVEFKFQSHTEHADRNQGTAQTRVLLLPLLLLRCSGHDLSVTTLVFCASRTTDCVCILLQVCTVLINGKLYLSFAGVHYGFSAASFCCALSNKTSRGSRLRIRHLR